MSALRIDVEALARPRARHRLVFVFNRHGAHYAGAGMRHLNTAPRMAGNAGYLISRRGARKILGHATPFGVPKVRQHACRIASLGVCWHVLFPFSRPVRVSVKRGPCATTIASLATPFGDVLWQPSRVGDSPVHASHQVCLWKLTNYHFALRDPDDFPNTGRGRQPPRLPTQAAGVHREDAAGRGARAAGAGVRAKPSQRPLPRPQVQHLGLVKHAGFAL